MGEDKPWRKPGADITDYFNYGFSEDTWAGYCNRQRRLRVNESGAGLTGGSAIVTQNRTAGPLTGSIPILGGSSADKLLGPPPTRKDLEPSGIQVMTHEKRIYPSKVIGSMDFSVPPPGFDPSLPPPTGGPPPDLSGPPPSGEFPPSDPFGEYPEAGRGRGKKARRRKSLTRKEKRNQAHVVRAVGSRKKIGTNRMARPK